MDHLIHLFIRFLVGLFLAGVIGCVIVIPIVAIKFGSVLFEPHGDDNNSEPKAVKDQ